MIGLDVSQQLADAGFEVVAPATSVRKALRLVAYRGCDIAVLDINLGGETSERIARKLQASGNPFVVLTGYSRDNPRPWCHDATPITMPPRTPDLVAALRQAITMGMEQTPVPIWPSPPDGRIKYLNPHWLADFDLRIKHAVGDSWTVIIHPHDRDESLAYQRFIARANPIRDGRGHIIRWSGTCIEVGGKGSENIGRGQKTESVLHYAPQTHAYRNSASNEEVDQSLSARHLLDQGDQDRYKGAGSPRSGPGRPEQPTGKAHLESGRRRFELPADYPPTRAVLEGNFSFAPHAVKALLFGLKMTHTEVADDKGQGIPDPCSFHVSADAWCGKQEQHFSKRLVETTSSNLSRARTEMSGCAAKEL